MHELLQHYESVLKTFENDPDEIVNIKIAIDDDYQAGKIHLSYFQGLIKKIYSILYQREEVLFRDTETPEEGIALLTGRGAEMLDTEKHGDKTRLIYVFND